MEDAARPWTGLSEGADMGHHVVAEPAFMGIGTGEVDILQVGPQFGELGRGDARTDVIVGQQAQLMLRLGQCQPEPPPGAELALRPPQLRHRPAGVTRDQRVVVNVAHEAVVSC